MNVPSFGFMAVGIINSLRSAQPEKPARVIRFRSASYLCDLYGARVLATHDEKENVTIINRDVYERATETEKSLLRKNRKKFMCGYDD